MHENICIRIITYSNLFASFNFTSLWETTFIRHLANIQSNVVNSLVTLLRTNYFYKLQIATPSEYKSNVGQLTTNVITQLTNSDFDPNDPQNMNMEKKFNYIKKSLTHYTSFEILHEKIEPEKIFFFLAGIPIPRVQFLRFLTKWHIKRENGEKCIIRGHFLESVGVF